MDLSKRQADVIQRVARGMSDKNIALDLGISVWTVRTYIGRIAVQLPGETPPRYRLTLFFFAVDTGTDES